MLEIIKPDFEFSDPRGKIVQLINKGYNQINVITSKKGAFRGGHFHKLNKEAFYIISGKLEIMVRNESGVRNFIFAEGVFFSIEAYDIHSFDFLEDTVLVSMYEKGVELANGAKDIYVPQEEV